MNTETNNIPAQTTYEDVTGYIYSLRKKCAKKYKNRGLTYDEIVDIINSAFMTSFNSYKPEKGSFPSWLWKKSLLRIKDTLKVKHSNRSKKFVSGTLYDFNDIPCRPDSPVFDLDSWTKDLSDDAKRICNLVLFPPIDIEVILIQRGGSRTNTRWVRAIKEFLLDDGWNYKRVRRAFNELEEKVNR